MANHLATRASWFDNTDLLYTELAHIDFKTVDSVSGTGGVYALTERLEIGGAPGADFFVTTPFTVDNEVLISSTLAAFGDQFFGSDAADTMTVVSQAEFQNNVTIGTDGSDALTVNAFTNFSDIVTFDSDTFFSAGADFNGAVTFDGSVALRGGITTIGLTGSDALTVEAFARFNDVVTFDGDTFFEAPSTFSAPVAMGAGGHIKKAIFQMTDADANRGPTTPCDEVHVPGGVLTANRSFTIVDAGEGSAMSFSTADAAHVVTIKNPGGVPIGTLTLASAYWVEVRKLGGVWQVTKSATV